MIREDRREEGKKADMKIEMLENIERLKVEINSPLVQEKSSQKHRHFCEDVEAQRCTRVACVSSWKLACVYLYRYMINLCQIKEYNASLT